MPLDDPADLTRKAWMSILAKAPAHRLANLAEDLGPKPEFAWLRAPEIGTVMVRGRMGGTGALFNVGEMTVTRGALQLESGKVGHAMVQGRDKAHCETAALLDALMQGARAGEIRATVLDPIMAEMARAARVRAARAAATRVEFFTMARGEG